MEVMIFNMDMSNSFNKKYMDEAALPCAPPPSPSLNSRRKPVNIIPLAKFVDSCEDLICRTSKINIGITSSSPLHMKRKTSDSDDCYSSGSSPGGNNTEYSCSVGKRSKSSFNLDSMTVSKSPSEMAVATSCPSTIFMKNV